MKNIKILLLSLSLILFMSACTNKTAYTNRSQMILMSQEKEMALGEQSYRKALSESKVERGTYNAQRVKNVGYKIAQAANMPKFKWEFNLVQSKDKNAFCLPGGKVVVYTGILDVAQNDAQLATVMSHEIAHAIARHGAERMSAAQVKSGLQSLGNIILSVAAPQYTNIFNQAYGLGSQLGVMLPYSRMQESEADEIGIHLMSKAGYNPYEALSFWKNMSENKKEGSDFFSTHPNSQNRINNIKKVIQKIQSK